MILILIPHIFDCDAEVPFLFGVYNWSATEKSIVLANLVNGS